MYRSIASWVRSLPQYKELEVKVVDVNGDTHKLSVKPNDKHYTFLDIQILGFKQATAHNVCKRSRFYMGWSPHLVRGFPVESTKHYRYIQLPDKQRFIFEDDGSTSSIELKGQLLLAGADPQVLSEFGTAYNIADYELVPKRFGDPAEAGLYLIMLNNNVYKCMNLT